MTTQLDTWLQSTSDLLGDSPEGRTAFANLVKIIRQILERLHDHESRLALIAEDLNEQQLQQLHTEIAQDLACVDALDKPNGRDR